MPELFQLGDFLLHSGERSRYKIDCDALSDASIECLAFMLAKRLPRFATVEGIPRGGLRIEKAMRQYAVPIYHPIKSAHVPLLIVDDVFTTGTSMRAAMLAHTELFAHEMIGAVIFARNPVHPMPAWITALFPLPPEINNA